MTTFKISQPINLKITLPLLEAKGYVITSSTLLHVSLFNSHGTRHNMRKNDIKIKIKAMKQT